MWKQLFSVAVAVMVISQGIARADPRAGGSAVPQAEGIVLQDARALRNQPGVVPHATPIRWKTVAILAAVTAGAALVVGVLLTKPAR